MNYYENFVIRAAILTYILRQNILYIIPVEPSFVTEFVTVEPFFIFVETLSICIFFVLNHLHLEIQIIIFALLRATHESSTHTTND